MRYHSTTSIHHFETLVPATQLQRSLREVEDRVSSGLFLRIMKLRNLA